MKWRMSHPGLALLWDRLVLTGYALAAVVGFAVFVAALTIGLTGKPEPQAIRCGPGLSYRVQGRTLIVNIARPGCAEDSVIEACR